ncbi:hypothetical protein WJX75_003958 [Coccomyxa subellipsoidea]|uniref:Uncharacterized protein n=1 Tax=Coccomyxa subellipsoidea TaxID=248742 RepID=A0ABR2Z097_9CHLO
MNYNEKLTWTFAAVAAASGSVWLFSEYGNSIQNGQTRQIVSCVLVFWLVFLVRSVMTFVWEFGIPKKEIPVGGGATAALKQEDEGEDASAQDATPARRRTRTRRDI